MLGAICWADGQLGQGLQLCREAARRAGGISPDARHFQPLLVLAARLVDLRQLDEASAILRGAVDAMQTPGRHPAGSIPAVLRARADLAQGRTGAARVAADTALGLAGSLQARTQSALARSVLSVIALRAGDLREAGQQLRSRPTSRTSPTAMPVPRRCWPGPCTWRRRPGRRRRPSCSATCTPRWPGTGRC